MISQQQPRILAVMQQPHIKAIAAWFKKCKVNTIVMDSTGFYWIPTFQILGAECFEVLLVNSHHVKNVPGRKSNVMDCQ